MGELIAVIIFAALMAFAFGWLWSSDDDGTLPKERDE